MPDSIVQPARISGGRGVPLSLSQQAALLPERTRQLPAVNLFVALEISGTVAIDVLERALTEVLIRYEILRTVYPADRRIPYQRVVPVPERVLESVRLDPAELAERLRADADQRLDLVEELPLRVRCYELADELSELSQRLVLSLVVHPVAADDHTLDLLIEALFAAYSGAPEGDPAQYRDYVSAQLQALTATAATDADLAYWTDRLAGLPARPTPVSDRNPAGAQREVLLDCDTVATLLGAQSAADPASVFAALISAMLTEAGLGADIPVGLVDPARTAPGAATALGNFANHLVLRCGAPEGRTAREVIADVARITAEANAHAGTRIERLTHLLGAGAAPGHSLFPVLLRVHAAAPAAATPSGWTVRELMRRTARPSGVDLVFDVAVTAAGARVRIDFPAVLAGLPVIDEFVTRFTDRCTAWAADLDAPLPAAAGGFALFAAPAAPSLDDMLPGRGGAPVTDTERLLVETIREILEFDDDDDIGREDTFFSLGGDSIAALRLVTLLGERGYSVEVQTVFGFPMLCELAAELDRTAGAPAQPAAPAEVAPMSASGLDDAALRALGRKFAGK